MVVLVVWSPTDGYISSWTCVASHIPNLGLLLLHLKISLLVQGSSLCPWTMLNLHDHFKWSCAMEPRFDTWMPSTSCVGLITNMYIFILGFSFHVHFINNLGFYYTPLCIYRNWLTPLSQYFLICSILLNIGHWDAYVQPIPILKT